MNKRCAPLVIGLLMAVLGACTRKAIPTQSRAEAPKVEDAVNTANLDFRYLSAKAKAQIETGGDKLPNVTLTLRMRKDSLIWLSIAAPVIGEVMRAHITPDSVQVIDRLHREYFAGNFTALRRRFNVPVTFQQVQALLAGNYVAAPAGSSPTVSTEGPLQKVVYQQQALLVEQLLETTRRRVQKLAVKDDSTQLQFTVDFSDFRPLERLPQEFANALLVVIEQPKAKPSSASINFRNVDVDKERLAFPFSVPSDYARKK
ncbi:DUF4292 domain-containing protein [Hymenobacter lutimineralis]|uniref:DUF4292 domain-containing protein n=1 Tax=Hymenobacter lutimineralis TaxID=2606448 RepID=A0A5D6VBY4_9BACT|nr:DUF4292 domain-containing protein [Hymenobacter lutimineralis]TYZ13423.1 DUF4292 domain-containing protein [Hymenobacter lutimineralis]